VSPQALRQADGRLPAGDREHRAELEAGSCRLGLAVEAPHTPAGEIAKLAYFARRQPDSRLFRAAVRAPASYAANGRLGAGRHP